MKKYDIIVLGSGPGGSSIALSMAKANYKVAVIDPLFGGTCALRGCTPKKAMESVTSAYWASKNFEGMGFPKLQDTVDWHQLMSHKSKFTTLVPAGKKAKFEEAVIDTYVAQAKFKDNNTIIAGSHTLSADKIIIATGAKPIELDFQGSQFAINSYDFFELDHLPKNIVIVGGGYVAFELSHIAAACGANVTILSKPEMPFAPFDSDVVKLLIQATLDKGIDVRLGYEANAIEEQDNAYKVTSLRNGGKEFTFNCDLVINATGRTPNIEALELSNTDVKLDEKGSIITDDFLAANASENIYAIGDVIGVHPFTEAANYEASVLKYNFTHERRKKVDYDGLPMVVYTYPKMAMVGKCSEQLDRDGIPHKVFEARLSNFFTQRAQANRFARYKTCVGKSSNEILGAHLFGCGVEEIINLFAMAIQTGIKENELKKLLLAYPTATHDIKFLFNS